MSRHLQNKVRIRQIVLRESRALLRNGVFHLKKGGHDTFHWFFRLGPGKIYANEAVRLSERGYTA